MVLVTPGVTGRLDEVLVMFQSAQCPEAVAFGWTLEVSVVASALVGATEKLLLVDVKLKSTQWSEEVVLWRPVG